MNMGHLQIGFSAQAILLLGITPWMGFCVAFYTHQTKVLVGVFAAYGFAAGLAFTAAAQLIGDVVDQLEGQAKEAANGIWNTAWEAGGSTGFFLGGLLAHHHEQQMSLTGRFALCAVVVAVCMVLVGREVPRACPEGKSLDYGSTA